MRITPPGGGGAERSNSEELITRSSPGIGRPTGFLASTRDFDWTILEPILCVMMDGLSEVVVDWFLSGDD